MKKLILVALLTLSTASAKSTSLAILLTGENYDQVKISYINEYNFYISQPTAIGGSLKTEVAFFGDRDNSLAGYTSIRFIEKKQYLFPEDMLIVKKNVFYTASRCFNISSTRKSEISSWLDQKNALSNIEASKNFGPMEITFVRKQLSRTNEYSTLLLLSREADPGRSTWANYCTR